MVGGRFSHSIDIGKDLEKEPPQKPAQEEETAPKEEAPTEEPEKPQESPEQSPESEAQQEASAPEQPDAEATATVHTAQELLDTIKEPAPGPDDEDEAPEGSSQPTDPVEEDVNEIINKGVLQLRSKETLSGRFSAYRILLSVLLIIVIGGLFWMYSQRTGTNDGAAAPHAGTDALVPNETAVSNATLVDVRVNDTPQTSKEELARILAQGLRD